MKLEYNGQQYNDQIDDCPDCDEELLGNTSEVTNDDGDVIEDKYECDNCGTVFEKVEE